MQNTIVMSASLFRATGAQGVSKSANRLSFIKSRNYFEPKQTFSHTIGAHTIISGYLGYPGRIIQQFHFFSWLLFYL